MSENQRFRIGDDPRIYSLAAVNEPSLRDLLSLKAELVELGITETWQDITAATEEMQSMGDNSDGHPLSLLVFAISIWAARRNAGDDVRFADAVDIKMSSIKWLTPPADRKAAAGSGKPQGGTKKPRKASAPAAAADTNLPTEPGSTSTV